MFAQCTTHCGVGTSLRRHKHANDRYSSSEHDVPCKQILVIQPRISITVINLIGTWKLRNLNSLGDWFFDSCFDQFLFNRSIGILPDMVALGVR